MAKVPKHRRIKRPTVLIKRTRCIKSTKPSNKTFSPIYQKLKVNNHSLAKALSQEKQESQMLFSRNVELLAEVQDLVHACNCRDLVIKNIMKNAKDMMATLVTMSSYLTNTISACQEFVSTSNILNRTSSSSSAGRRESTKRLSTKSPARGVVKPMVSGHTITKPTINLSRVNMQRLQNVNLSVIEESSSSPERNLERSSETRRSRPLPVPTMRIDDEEERAVVNRRTSRFSTGRLSSGRYSKRNSGRLSGGGGVAGRLSKRSSDHSELIPKSPRVTLQDVSRYLTNNQTVNVRLLSETDTSRRLSRTVVEDTEMSDQSSPLRNSSQGLVIPETQDSAVTSDSEEEEDSMIVTVRSRKQSSLTSTKSSKSSKKSDSGPARVTSVTNSDACDPLEGSSWMYEDVPTGTEDSTMNENIESNPESEDAQVLPDRSPVSSLSISERRRTSAYFRVPELPKGLGKMNTSKLRMDDVFDETAADLPNAVSDEGNMFSDYNDDEDQRPGLRFITQRRGPSVRSGPSNANVLDDAYDDDDDDEDEDTLMINMRRQIKPHPNQTQQQPIEQPERLQFNMDELMKLTPLKSLQNIQRYNGAAQIEDEPEPTVTVQLTSRLPRPTDNTDTLSRQSTVKLHRLAAEQSIVRSQEPAGNGNHRRMSELTTTKIELPRLTDVLNVTEDNHQQTQMIQTPEIRIEPVNKRKRILSRPIEYSASEDNEEEEVPKKAKKAKGKKKKVQPEKDKDKDPSAAKVVLKKLNDTQRSSTQSDNGRTVERKNSDESLASMRSSNLSRADPSSDSESSITSGKQISTRPRRQKAPKNLAEPSLGKKLRRN